MKTRTLVVLCAAIGCGVTCMANELMANDNQYVIAPGAGGQAGGYFVRMEGKVVKGQPYSADVVNESIQVLGDGNRIVHRTTGRVFRDVEGRVRHEDDRPNGAPAISISDPVANESWTLDPAQKTARETGSMVTVNVRGSLGELNNIVRGLKESRAGGRGGAGAGSDAGASAGAGAGVGVGRGGARGGGAVLMPVEKNANMVVRAGGRGGRGGDASDERTVEPLNNKSIENLLCSGVRRTTTIAKGAIGNEQPIKIVSEEWTSIDLQVLVLTDLNDPRTGRTTYKLTNVRRADPDLSLFKVPADYTIVRGGGGRGRGGN